MTVSQPVIKTVVYMCNIPKCLQGVSRYIFSVISIINVFSMPIFARHILVAKKLCPGTFVECRTGVRNGLGEVCHSLPDVVEVVKGVRVTPGHQNQRSSSSSSSRSWSWSHHARVISSHSVVVTSHGVEGGEGVEHHCLVNCTCSKNNLE